MPLFVLSLIPVELALRLGIGMVRALAALNKAGFNHRLVSPHSFSYFTPPNVESLINRLIITDLSLCIAWPRKYEFKKIILKLFFYIIRFTVLLDLGTMSLLLELSVTAPSLSISVENKVPTPTSSR